MRAETFEVDRNIVGTLAAEADADGIVVYGSPKESSAMKAPDPRALWEAVEGWREAAAEDRRVAASCLALDPPVRGAAAFHCQQAIEKLLKGFLMLAAKRSRKTHSLAQLGAAAQERFPEISDLADAVKDWGRWAVDFRYPTRRGRTKPAPDEDELRRGLAVIDALAARLRAANPEPETP
jgi:HEPN domain-containing protein